MGSLALYISLAVGHAQLAASMQSSVEAVLPAHGRLFPLEGQEERSAPDALIINVALPGTHAKYGSGEDAPSRLWHDGDDGSSPLLSLADGPHGGVHVMGEQGGTGPPCRWRYVHRAAACRR